MFLGEFFKLKLVTNWGLFQYSVIFSGLKILGNVPNTYKSFWNTLISPKTARILDLAMTPKSVSLGTRVANVCMLAKTLVRTIKP